ncbi:hypothetical protein [Mangrovimonas yunxiaonensis]|uniref:hypothetical protein n=1 Tax=Mangrovimonas yunxiaonensis TaxID=1197477 RepID=UPI00166F022C|nr:hypothetical protein [Mangrovimonas yunxiaonensis]
MESDFLFKYLKDNIIGLLLTLLAINTATLGLIASKIQDIVVDYPKFDFSSTIKEMKTSLLEQIILICTSVITLLLLDSNKIDFAYKTDIGNVILTTVLIYSVTILWDTGKAVFVVIEELQNMNKNKK